MTETDCLAFHRLWRRACLAFGQDRTTDPGVLAEREEVYFLALEGFMVEDVTAAAQALISAPEGDGRFFPTAAEWCAAAREIIRKRSGPRPYESRHEEPEQTVGLVAAREKFWRDYRALVQRLSMPRAKGAA